MLKYFCGAYLPVTTFCLQLFVADNILCYKVWLLLKASKVILNNEISRFMVLRTYYEQITECLIAKDEQCNYDTNYLQ